MSFHGDYEGALWAIATGTSGGQDCENAEIMRGVAQEALGVAWTDYLNHKQGAKEAFGQVIDFKPESPEQPEQPSTETVADEIEGTPAPLPAEPKVWSSVSHPNEGGQAGPIEPLTDLTGVDYAPAFEGYQPNGALPETD